MAFILIDVLRLIANWALPFLPKTNTVSDLTFRGISFFLYLLLHWPRVDKMFAGNFAVHISLSLTLNLNYGLDPETNP